MLKKMVFLFLILSFIITMVGCRGVPTVPPISPEPEGSFSEEFVLVQVIDPESNIIFVIGKENEDAMAILGEKNIAGEPTNITGAVYVSEQGDSFVIEAGIDGLPIHAIDSEGNTVIFENYTNSTVDISIYDSNGISIQGLTTINVDPADLLELKLLYNSFYSRQRWSGKNTADVFKWGSVVFSGVGCKVSLSSGFVPAMVLACGGAIFSTWAAITPDDTDNIISTVIGAGSCVFSGGQNVWACGSTILGVVNLGEDSDDSNDTEIPEPTEAIFQFGKLVLGGISCRLVWKDNSDNEVGFLIQRMTTVYNPWSEVPDHTPFVTIARVGPNVTEYTDIAPLAAYVLVYRVAAIAADGRLSEWTTFSESVVVGRPTELQAEVSGSPLHVKLSWKDNSRNELGFRIYRWTGIGEGPWLEQSDTEWPLLGTVGANGETFTDVEVKSGYTYRYFVVAFNDDGSSLPSDVETVFIPSQQPTLSFTGLTPSQISTNTAPYDAMLSASGSNFNNVNRVSFSWSGAASGSATWNKGDTNWNTKVTVNSDTSMTLKPGVVETNPTWSGTVYWTVTLRDNTGATASRSFTVTYTVITPSLVPPTGFSVSSSWNTTSPGFPSMALSWNAVSGATGYEMWVRPSGGSYASLGTRDAPYVTFNSNSLPGGARYVSGTTYYFKVRTVTASGTSDFTSEVPCVAAAAPSPSIGQVQLSSPSNGATLPPMNVTFIWNSVSNATKYQFILYNQQGQVALDTTYSSTFAIVALGTEETITWKVRAGDKSGNWGAWSSTWSLTIKSNTIINKPDLIVSNIRIEPNPPIAAGYTTIGIEIKNQGNADATKTFSLDFYFDNTYRGRVDINGLTAGSTYTSYWKAIIWPSDTNLHTIKGVVDPDNTIIESNESNNQYSIQVKATAPPIGTGTLKIESVPRSAKVYIDGVYKGETPSSGYLTISNLAAGDHGLKVTKLGYKDWIGVVTIPSGSTKYEAVILESITTKPLPPTPLSPGSSSAPGQTIDTLTPTLKWQTVSNADYYALAISVYPYGPSYVIYNPQKIYGSSITVPSGKLEARKKYRWNMQSYNSAGWSEEVSSTLYFQTSGAKPLPPTPLSPGTTSAPGPVIYTLTPTLKWQTVSNADYYALAISVYPYGSSNIIYNPQQIYGSSITVPSGKLEAGKKYRWNMQSYNSAGWSEEVSSTLYFQTSP